MNACIKTDYTELDDHIKLVQLISEESTLLGKAISPDMIKRHTRILRYLVELQTLKAKELL